MVSLLVYFILIEKRTFYKTDLGSPELLNPIEDDYKRHKVEDFLYHKGPLVPTVFDSNYTNNKNPLIMKERDPSSPTTTSRVCPPRV